ncbi:MAG: iron complex outermembrane receptor protein [Psychroserpens sp.]|jgi:iron complex outermembrane receptor protein
MSIQRIKSKLSLAILSALTLSSFTAPVFAEESKDDKDLEKITVTAQKRTERLSEIPVAVSVISGDQIDSAFSSSFESLQSLSPSVSFKKGTTSRNSAVTVRGIGTISFSVAAEPSVSTVVDGVVLGRSGQAFTDLYDLERIEVLRGPQGTLFGKNASAGVVNITTKRPSGDTEGMLEATLFQGNEYRLKGKIQGQITDKAAGSFIATKSGYDGNLFNVYNNQQVNGYDKQGFRAMLDVETSSDSKMLFIFESAESNDDCCADIEGLPSGRNPNSAAAPNSNGIVDGVADFDLDQRQVDHDFESRTSDKTTAFSVQFDKEIGDYSLTSITAYREWENIEYREGDFTSIAGDSTEPVFGVPFQLHDVGPQTWRQFSQELRIASPVGEKLDWQAGAFFWKMDSERNFTRDASCQDNNGQFDQAISNYLTTNMDIENPDEQQIADFIESEDLSCNANDIVSATAYMGTEFTNWALFGDGKYHFSDEFTLLFGARYTDDQVEYTHTRVSNDPYGRRGVGVRPATENTNFAGSTSNTDTSIKLGAQYDLGDAGMVYTTYSQGYKGPGFNVFYNMADKDTAPISEEISDAYEFGYKYASHDFMFNAAIFRTEIEGFQANNFDNSSGVTITRLTNAGNVSTQGFEFDFVWQATEDLTLSGGLSKIDAEIDEFFCPVGENCTDRSGLDVPFSPDMKYSLTADYVTELGYMDIIWNATYVYTDEQVATLPSNTGEFSPAVQLPDYSILNASVAFSFDNDAYRVSLIGKNLTDEQYFTSYSGDGFRYQVPRDADRYFGVQFRTNF